MKQPLIGIVPLVDEARESYWMLPGYMQGVEQAGGVPIMMPPHCGSWPIPAMAFC